MIDAADISIDHGVCRIVDYDWPVGWSPRLLADRGRPVSIPPGQEKCLGFDCWQREVPSCDIGPHRRIAKHRIANVCKPRPFVYKWDTLRSQGMSAMYDGPIPDQRCG
jgi:hypothetical protein